MSRNRLTNRTASDMKSKPGAQVEAKGSGVDNDVYNMNDTGHEKNDPSVSEYAKGDPSAWAEDVNKILGINISVEDMEKELDRLDFPYKLNKTSGKYAELIPREQIDAIRQIYKIPPL